MQILRHVQVQEETPYEIANRRGVHCDVAYYGNAQDATVASPVSGTQLVASYTQPDISIGELPNISTPWPLVETDQGFLLGGIGSDLFHDPSDPANVFWAVTGRGRLVKPRSMAKQ